MIDVVDFNGENAITSTLKNNKNKEDETLEMDPI